MSELARHPGRSFDIGELTRLTHGVAPDVAKAVAHLKGAGLIVATKNKGVVRVELSGPKPTDAADADLLS
jgi:hypothetical protein